MPADPDIPATLRRHAERRRAGIATVTVFVGPIGPARRAWTAHASTVLETLADPVAGLSAWANKHPAELRIAVLTHLARRKGHDPQAFITAWESKTRADLAMFWEAIPPQPGDNHLRSLLDPSAQFQPELVCGPYGFTTSPANKVSAQISGTYCRRCRSD